MVILLQLWSSLRFSTVACTVSVPSMSCVSFSDWRKLGLPCLVWHHFLLHWRCVMYSSLPFWFDRRYISLAGSRSLQTCYLTYNPKGCHSSPHFLTFLTPSLRIVSYSVLPCVSSQFTVFTCVMYMSHLSEMTFRIHFFFLDWVWVDA